MPEAGSCAGGDLERVGLLIGAWEMACRRSHGADRQGTAILASATHAADAKVPWQSLKYATRPRQRRLQAGFASKQRAWSAI